MYKTTELLKDTGIHLVTLVSGNNEISLRTMHQIYIYIDIWLMVGGIFTN